MMMNRQVVTLPTHHGSTFHTMVGPHGLRAAFLHTFEQKRSVVPLGIFWHMLQALT